MSSASHVLLDEHVSRVFERVLRECGCQVTQAKDRFGEQTTDEELLQWCADNNVLLLSNNAKDFEALHKELDHAGLLLYYTQDLPDRDPEGLARTVEEVLGQYGSDELANSLVNLDEWHEWLNE
ncbi:DUF5615 family PIN-like protein [Salinibaculum rarum]|uniref:DUF5615 family PIN-like protein n=1 Tax=Salinibaculum rarum TaxID=3058903 RepID=UPI00265D79DC|nr:DUF5615 family PIN-like protein [Salinibaculum sp. KK48]